VTSFAADDSAGAVDPLPVVNLCQPEGRRTKPPKFGAAPAEWRTPPLWALRDSAPYLHDGRAETLREAIAFHCGEGADAAERFAELSTRERRQVESFLEVLPLPGR
jgi:CxxC motif-containing protein (DUF1111 family)